MQLIVEQHASEVNAIEEQQLKQTQETAAEVHTMESNSFGGCNSADRSRHKVFLLRFTFNSYCMLDVDWNKVTCFLVMMNYCIECNNTLQHKDNVPN